MLKINSLLPALACVLTVVTILAMLVVGMYAQVLLATKWLVVGALLLTTNLAAMDEMLVNVVDIDTHIHAVVATTALSLATLCATRAFAPPFMLGTFSCTKPLNPRLLCIVFL